MSEVWSLSTSIIVFAVAASVTVFGGVRLARLGDILADRMDGARRSSTPSSSEE